MGIVKDLIYGSIMFTCGYFVGLVTSSDDITEHLQIKEKSRQLYRTIDDRVGLDQKKSSGSQAMATAEGDPSYAVSYTAIMRDHPVLSYR